jgi:hypothetical protein
MKQLSETQMHALVKDVVSTPDREARFAAIEEQLLEQIRRQPPTTSIRSWIVVVLTGMALSGLALWLWAPWQEPVTVSLPAPISNQTPAAVPEVAEPTVRIEPQVRVPDHPQERVSEPQLSTRSSASDIAQPQSSVAVISTTDSESIEAQARRAADSLIRNLHSTSDPRQQAALLFAIGMRYSVAQDYTAAARYLERATSEAGTLGDRRMEARSMLHHGLALMKQGKMQAGEARCSTAIALLPATESNLRDQWTRLVQNARK